MKIYVLSGYTTDDGNGSSIKPAAYRTKAAAQRRMAEVASEAMVEWLTSVGPECMSIKREPDGNYVELSDEDDWSMRLQVDEDELEED